MVIRSILHILWSGIVAGNELFPGDLVTTKVWLDRHVFNDTLKSKLSPAGHKIFVMSEDKVLTQGLAWPPKFKPTLCFVGLGRASLEMYVALHQLFPDLRIVLLDVQDLAYLVIAAKELDVDVESLATASLDDFVEGVERCNVIQWSLDSPAFSFFKYRDLFYSTPYILGLFNLQGCNPPWRLNGIPVDRYYCEYLYQGFKATICGKVNENNFADYMGQELYFPMVDAGCGENICLCHAHSDAYIDFHLELLCRYEGHKQFMGQWGQDEFLVENVFGKNDLRGEGIYVDVGSSHPYHLSNTAYLDTCLNWRGVCMEPNPRLKHIIRGVRTCSVIDACAWANKTTMKFANGLELAARTDAAELKPSTPGEIEEDTHPSETFFEARCDSLHQLMLEGLGQLLNHSEVADILENRKKPRVDLLSVDAEGSELEIFKDFPFEVAAEARSACRQVSQRNRGTCPFDDHSAFGASAAAQPRHAPMATADARRTHQEAHELRRNNRQAQQKIGVGTPWDAPEPATVARASCCQAAQQAALAAGGSDARAAVHNEAMAEAKRYRERMHGSQDLIAGNYWLGDGLAAARNQALPAPGKVLMPGAHMKLQYDGGSLQTLTHERAEYLNSRILAENNRARNEAALQLS